MPGFLNGRMISGANMPASPSPPSPGSIWVSTVSPFAGPYRAVGVIGNGTIHVAPASGAYTYATAFIPISTSFTWEQKTLPTGYVPFGPIIRHPTGNQIVMLVKQSPLNPASPVCPITLDTGSNFWSAVSTDGPYGASTPITVFMYSPSIDKYLIMCDADDMMYRYDSALLSWTTSSVEINDPNNTFRGSSIVADTAHNTVVLVGEATVSSAAVGIIQRSSDGGMTWTNATPTSPAMPPLTTVLYDSFHNRLVTWGQTFRNTWYSDDGGIVWRAGGLLASNAAHPPGAVYSSGQHSIIAPCELTSQNVDYSPDGGATWYQDGNKVDSSQYICAYSELDGFTVAVANHSSATGSIMWRAD